MITQVLHCPNCHSTDIVKHGRSPESACLPQFVQNSNCHNAVANNHKASLALARDRDLL